MKPVDLQPKAALCRQVVYFDVGGSMRAILLIVSVLLICACDQKKYTVDDFIKSEDLRSDFQRKCNDKESLNCRNFLSAINIIQKAEMGDVKEQLFLGDVYLSAHKFKDAIYWLAKAADKDNDKAIGELGIIAYVIGSKKSLTGDERDMLGFLEEKLSSYKRKDRPVLRYYLRHLSEGDTEALISLGLMYETGQGAEKNYDTAISYFKRYAEVKKVKTPGWGEYYLGYMALDGEGFKKNEKQAADLFDKSCGMGFKLSCYKLGDLYFHGGDGFKPDYKKATELLDVYSMGKYIDSRAIKYAGSLFEMYKAGGFGISKNSQRIQQLKEILCPGYGYLLDSCEE